MGDVIKVDFGGEKDKKEDESNPADSAANKPADVVEIKPVGNREREKDEDAGSYRDIIESAAKESPFEEVRRLNKMTEALTYIASPAGVIPPKLRSGSSYKDSVIVFQNMYSQGAKDELFRIFDDSSKEKWKTNPGYYLALIEVLRRKDIPSQL